MDLRAVFLDVGNTLVHEVPSRFEIYAAAARKRGHDLDERTMGRLMRDAHHGLPDRIDGAFRYSDPWFRVYIERIFCTELGISPDEVANITGELFEQFENPATFRLFAGARELITALREAGLSVGIISNWSARLPRVLAGLELDTAFDFVLCSAIEEMEKPDAAIFRRALELSKAPAEACLHAGDHPEKDVTAAKALGIRAILVDHAGEHPESPHARVSSLAELGNAILQNQGDVAMDSTMDSNR